MSVGKKRRERREGGGGGTREGERKEGKRGKREGGSVSPNTATVSEQVA